MIKSSLLVIVSFFIPFIFADIIFGKVMGMTDVNSTSVLINNDKKSGYYNKPNIIISFDYDKKNYFSKYKMIVCTDPSGFRIPCKPVSNSLQSNEKAVLVGDSVLFGAGVNYEETFAFHLQNLIKYKIINTGVMGYNIEQQISQLEEKSIMSAYKPRLIGFQFCVNDFENIIRQWDEKTQTLSAQNIISNIPILRESNIITYAANNVYYKYLFKQYVPDGDEFLADISEDAIHHYTEKLLNKILDFKKNGQQVFFIFIPTKNQMGLSHQNYYKLSSQNIVKQILNKENIPFVDCFDRFKKARKSVFIDRTHLNSHGHELCGQEIYQFLQNENML